MNRWLLVAVCLIVTACNSQPTPTPIIITETPSAIATLVPIPTLLPTVVVAVPTLQNQTTIATLPAATAQIAATRASTTRFSAPTQIAPSEGALFKAGNDIQFTYASVGKLEPNQCYLLHVELAVPNLEKGNRGDDFLDAEHCGDQSAVGTELNFVLYRGKFTNSPNYGTMLAQTLALEPEAKLLKMSWTIRVVQNNGRAADGVHYNTVALSPSSPVREFDFEP